MKLIEASTIRARAKAMMKALEELLSEKTLSSTLRKQFEGMSIAMSKTWADMKADADMDPVREAANIGNWFEAKIHTSFTEYADNMFADGYLSREERIALSSAIGSALESFVVRVGELVPTLYARKPFESPAPMQGMVEADLGDEDTIMLTEKAVRSNGTIEVKVIEPGWGSTGYYSEQILARDGKSAFPAGTKMYWNHQTPAEEAARPEGDLTALAGELVTNASWVEGHPAGTGLYAEAKIFEPYVKAVNELAPHIGVSIRARGRYTPGTAEGRVGPIITSIARAKSVDFVTLPGAGGQIVQLFESRNFSESKLESVTTGDIMDEKDILVLQESNTKLLAQVDQQTKDLARLQEADILREANTLVASGLKDEKLPAITKDRLQKALVVNLPMKDGKLDIDALKLDVVESAKAEREYLISVGSGRITGMGETVEIALKPEELNSALADGFMRIGLSESASKLASKGR